MGIFGGGLGMSSGQGADNVDVQDQGHRGYEGRAIRLGPCNGLLDEDAGHAPKVEKHPWHGQEADALQDWLEVGASSETGDRVADRVVA